MGFFLIVLTHDKFTSKVVIGTILSVEEGVSPIAESMGKYRNS